MGHILAHSHYTRLLLRCFPFSGQKESDYQEEFRLGLHYPHLGVLKLALLLRLSAFRNYCYPTWDHHRTSRFYVRSDLILCSLCGYARFIDRGDTFRPKRFDEPTGRRGLD